MMTQMLTPAAIAEMTDDELAVASFSIDQRLAHLVDDDDSPLWQERQIVDAEIARRGLG